MLPEVPVLVLLPLVAIGLTVRWPIWHRRAAVAPSPAGREPCPSARLIQSREELDDAVGRAAALLTPYADIVEISRKPVGPHPTQVSDQPRSA